MGKWRIVVEGTGCHHNSNPEIDANEKAKAFVAELKKGQTIHNATFEVKVREDLYGTPESLDS